MSNLQTIYSVLAVKNKLQCIDTSSGCIKGSYNCEGEILSGPIVTGDRCVVTLSTPSGRKGKIFKLPNFNLVTSFNL